MYAAGLAAVEPRVVVRRLTFLPDGVRFHDEELRPSGKFVLVALGKAGPGLAAAFLAATLRPPDTAFVLAPDGVEAPSSVAPFLRLASHPVADLRGEHATLELLDLLAGLSRDDGVLVLLSGGASALLAAPLPHINRTEIADLTVALLRAGTPIGELNTVRKHLLAAAGGRLAAACPAAVLGLALSDVSGDEPSLIASGPVTADPTTFAEARAVLARRGVEGRFPEIVRFLDAGVSGLVDETPKPGDPRLSRARTRLLAGNRDALAAASAYAREVGFVSHILTTVLHGEAREVGSALGALARAVGSAEPLALFAGGETTVTVVGQGCGGRNLELALAAARRLAGSDERCLLAAATDGVDGASPAAGAVVDGGTIERAVARGRDPEGDLAANDSWGFFAGSREAIVTGVTGTNVADLVVVLAAGKPSEALPLTSALSLTTPPPPH